MVLLPAIGRVVMYRPGEGDTNTSKQPAHAAVITRVHSPTCVNLCVLRDGMGPIQISSVDQSPRNSVHSLATMGVAADDEHPPRSWFWPAWS